MIELINQEIDQLKPQLIQDLQMLISFPSKLGPAEEGAPYGRSCRRVLDAALAMCEEKGFATRDVDHRMGYCYIGDSEEYVCAMGHLDVVEEGEGWTYPPFAGEIHDGRMYSRGALDNKGPLLAAFYGLYALKRLGVPFHRQFRIIFGTKEETGMEDLKHYLTKEQPPLIGFTPDNKFPAIYGERGRAKYKLIGSLSQIEHFLNEKIFKGDPVKNLNIDYRDEDFGRMILRGLSIAREGDQEALSFTLSLPVCDIEEVESRLEREIGSLKLVRLSYLPHKLEDKEDSLVQLLNTAYQEYMGTEISPTTTTGMTYAHYCPHMIGFGPSFPGQNGIAHLPDEWMDIEDLMKCAKIYAYAFYRMNEALKR